MAGTKVCTGDRIGERSVVRVGILGGDAGTSGQGGGNPAPGGLFISASHKRRGF